MGLSAWYEFIGRRVDNRGDILVRLAQKLSWSLPPSICSEILHALLVESAYWTPLIKGADRAQLLHHLVELLDTAPHELRPQLACSLAVLTLCLNHGTTQFQPHQGPDSDDIDLETASPRNLGREVTRYYLVNKDRFVADEQPLLLLALTGLMEHYKHNPFDDEGQESMKLVAQQLATLDVLGKPQQVVMPKELATRDIREYFAEVLALYLRQAQTSPDIQSTDETLVRLLTAIKHKLHFLVNNNSLLALPILQILSRTNNNELKRLCLSTIASIYNHSSELGPSLLHIQKLFSINIPYKLVQLAKEGPEVGSALHSNISSVFQFIAKHMQHSTPGPQRMRNDAQTIYDNIQESSSDLLKRIIMDDLLQAFIQHVLSSHVGVVSPKGGFWEREVLRQVEANPEGKLGGIYRYLKKDLRIRGAADPEQTQSAAGGSQGNNDFLTELFKLIDTPERS